MEVETKLVPPSGFSMPGLLDVVVGTRPTGGGVGPAEPVRLVARYFDVFWSALPRSLGMIGAGLLVLGIAWVLERQRKRLLERMAES